MLLEVLTPDAITRWPQSGERITGAMACLRVYQNYPGGPPRYVTMDAEAAPQHSDTINRFFTAIQTGDYPVGEGRLAARSRGVVAPTAIASDTGWSAR